MSGKTDKDDEQAAERFRSLLALLARVPKSEVDELEVERRKADTRTAPKPGRPKTRPSVGS